MLPVVMFIAPFVYSAFALPAIYGRLQRNSNPYENMNQHDYNKLLLELKNSAGNPPLFPYLDYLPVVQEEQPQNNFPVYDSWADVGQVYDAPFDESSVQDVVVPNYQMKYPLDSDVRDAKLLQEIMDNFVPQRETKDSTKKALKTAKTTRKTKTSTTATTTSTPVSSTVAPVLESMPGVLSKGGQKEYAMLRPSTDFRRNIPVWLNDENSPDDEEVVELKRAARTPKFVSDKLTDELGKLKH